MGADLYIRREICTRPLLAVLYCSCCRCWLVKNKNHYLTSADHEKL
ncbi:hypothetical protein T03_11411 [Trichinella britovi]|uniref:Uncharacterized protein n=1 Tax=Trichinella britovi TaxID=45882 RepID=A0A0V1ALM3_TRIBR|nr:hypothetical protein T03_10972 [Trichinella britovi]KRY25466.1 hypothetical protein T03_11411 [Trichinella britovi]